jgi:hypothetical protein
VSVSVGANTNKNFLAPPTISRSLITSLSPSASGCKKPQNPTVPGPRLRCIPAITFLSASVKYAIVTNKGTSVKSVKFKINIIKVNI